MPAGAVGSTWGTGSWPGTAWEAGAWADGHIDVIHTLVFSRDRIGLPDSPAFSSPVATTPTGRKQFLVAEAIPERSTERYQVDLWTPDEEADLVTPSQVTSILLTLRDLTSNTIVNARTAVEVKNTNGGTLEDGVFAFTFEEEDTAILGDASVERRLLTLDVRLSGGGRVTREIYFYVRNFRDITT